MWNREKLQKNRLIKRIAYSQKNGTEKYIVPRIPVLRDASSSIGHAKMSPELIFGFRASFRSSSKSRIFEVFYLFSITFEFGPWRSRPIYE